MPQLRTGSHGRSSRAGSGKGLMDRWKGTNEPFSEGEGMNGPFSEREREGN